MSRHVAILAIFSLCSVPSMAAQSAGDRLSLDDFLEIEEALNPQISPDGRQVIYTRKWVDQMTDTWATALWIVNADGSQHRHLTQGSAATWSPDGNRIAFVRTGEPRGAQIFVRWMDAEGATSQITRLDASPGSLRWSPDGSAIAFTMMVPTRERFEADIPSPPEGATWTAAPKIVTRLDYRRNTVGYIDAGYRHVFAVDADGGTPRQLTDGDWNHGAPAWTTDGSEVLFVSHRVPEAEWIFSESEIYAADAETGTIRRLTTRRGPDYAPAASPDGRLVAYVGIDSTDATYATSDVYLMNLDGSSPRPITRDLLESPGPLRWASDGRGVYFNSNERGRTHLYFAPVDGGGARQLTDGDHLLQTTSISRTGRAAAVRTDAHEPGDVFVFDLDEPADLRRLTAVNEDVLAGRPLNEVEEIWYPSFDGLPIQGWIVKPPDFDPTREYPLALAIHGGPHGMYGFGGSPVGGGVYYWFDWQYFAAHDYVVLYTNPRGSSGYGTDFGNAIKNAYPGDDYRDLMIGVDSLLARGYVDEDNMSVFGCSGGGILTAWIVGHTDRFASASTNCTVVNWMSFVGTTDGVGWYRNFEELPWEDPSEHLRRSPIMYVGNVKTPTMIQVGAEDLRTPVSQSEEYYQALKFLKVPTMLVKYHGEPHGFHIKPSNQMRSLAYMRSWFEKHARKPVETATSDGR